MPKGKESKEKKSECPHNQGYIEEEFNNEIFSLSSDLDASLTSYNLERLFTSNFKDILDTCDNSFESDPEVSDNSFSKPKASSTDTTPVRKNKHSTSQKGSASAESSPTKVDTWATHHLPTKVKSLIHLYDSKENINEDHLASARPLRSNSKPSSSSDLDHISKIDPTTKSRSKASRESDPNLNTEYNSGKQISSTIAMENKNLVARQLAIFKHSDTGLQKIQSETIPLLENTNRTKTDIEHLERHLSALSTLKDTFKSRLSHVEGLVNNTDPSDPDFTSFLELSDKYSAIQSQSLNLIEKSKDAIASWKKDELVLDAQRIAIPKFAGNSLEWPEFKRKFLSLTNGLGKANQLLRLEEGLTGDAKDRVASLLNGQHQFDEIFKTLDDHYGNPKCITDDTIKALFDIERPQANNYCAKEIDEHFTAFKNLGFNIMRLGHSTEELLCAIYLLNVPGNIRAKIEYNLDKSKTKLSFKDLTEVLREIVRVQKYKEANDTKLVSCNIGDTNEVTVAIGSSNPQTYTSRQNTRRNPSSTNYQQFPSGEANEGRGGYKGGSFRGGNGDRDNSYQNNYQHQPQQNQSFIQNYDHQSQFQHQNQPPFRYQFQNSYQPQRQQPPTWKCYLCGEFGHRFYNCMKFTHGKILRERLSELNRCTACCELGYKQQPCCYPRVQCDKDCENKDIIHNPATCGGKGDIHPGSQFSNKK